MIHKAKEFPFILILTVCFVWCLLALGLFAAHHFYPNYSGTLGDSLGILNSLFSALAFGGVVYSLIHQSTAFEKQEIEIERNRMERRVEQFETTFFNMLAAQREIVNELEVGIMVYDEHDGEHFTKTNGRQCFKTLYVDIFLIEIRKAKRIHKSNQTEINKSSFDLLDIVGVYENVFDSYKDTLSHYFRHLYHIAKLIDSGSKEIDKSKYAGILRAQFSTYEFGFLFYNGLSQYGMRFQGLIENLNLLKGVDEYILYNGEEDKYNDFGYELSAFDETEDELGEVDFETYKNDVV